MCSVPDTIQLQHWLTLVLATRGAQRLQITNMKESAERIRGEADAHLVELEDAGITWCSSRFANTDLDLQLKKHGIHKLIVIGLIAHTCIEATVRYAAELGYEVTVIKDATADYSDEMMHAALDINIPNYASAIVTAKEVVDSIASSEITAE